MVEFSPRGAKTKIRRSHVKCGRAVFIYCEKAPPAGGGGENCTAARNISGYGKVLSLRPYGAPPSQREARETACDLQLLQRCLHALDGLLFPHHRGQVGAAARGAGLAGEGDA